MNNSWPGICTPTGAMGAAAPGRCADCGSDAYIQLAVQDAMLCAHCYAVRLGLSRVAGRKGGEPEKPVAGALRRPS
jgi:hypothetical protein